MIRHCFIWELMDTVPLNSPMKYVTGTWKINNFYWRYLLAFDDIPKLLLVALPQLFLYLVPLLFFVQVHSADNSEPSGACPSDASHCDDNGSPVTDLRQLPRSLPVPFLPDVASVGGRAAVSPCVVSGSPPRIYSSNTGRSPGSGTPTVQKRPWFGESIFG